MIRYSGARSNIEVGGTIAPKPSGVYRPQSKKGEFARDKKNIRDNDAAMRVLRILKSDAEMHRPCATLKEISRRTNIGPYTVHRGIEALKQAGIITITDRRATHIVTIIETGKSTARRTPNAW